VRRVFPHARHLRLPDARALLAPDMEGRAVSRPQHTPGPWRKDALGRLVGSDGSRVVDSGSGLAFGSETSYPTAPANALLIEAAPDLLAALREIEGIAHPNSHISAIARAAIEKATKP